MSRVKLVSQHALSEDAMDIEKILEEYRNGDESMRLRLFLAFRDLRDHFSEIEHERPNNDFALMGFPWIGKRHVPRAA
jgi:hypothetical protein